MVNDTKRKCREKETEPPIQWIAKIAESDLKADRLLYSRKVLIGINEGESRTIGYYLFDNFTIDDIFRFSPTTHETTNKLNNQGKCFISNLS